MTEPRHSGKLRNSENDGGPAQTTVTDDDRPRNEPGRRPRPSPAAVLWGLALWLTLVELLWFVVHELIRLAN